MSESGYPDLPADAPGGLADSLATCGANVVRFWREGVRAYAEAESPQGRLFVRYTGDPSGFARLEHEEAVRAMIPTSGALRTPAVLASGPGWMLDQAIRPEPLRGEAAIEAAAAATELAGRRLPDPPGGARDLLPSRVRRRLALARSPIGIREQLTARRLLARSELPRETSHGDFHAGNILIADGSAFVVDWENCGIRPAGFDLIRLWMTLDDEPDREHLLKRALDLVGPDRHAELMRLRYAVLVGVLAGMTTALASYDRDPYRTRQMLALLPQVREQAKG